MENSTIAAISTAYGESGIGVVRMSGPASLSIAEKIFEGRSLGETPRFMHYGKIKDPKNGAYLDEVLCVYMKAPHTYTGEDLVEIQCHGSIISLKEILDLCLRSGAEPAERGEFTKRAFLNGRIDLSQAEAVIDLIKARTSMSFDVALSQMQGSLSFKVKEIRKKLLDLLVSLTVNMDYPDEDIEEITYDNIKNSLLPINNELSNLLASADEGKIIREGLGIAIVGKPNVGKSSLMNIFLSEDRSIVTDVPGTTRDTIEETAVLRGFPVRLTDTAGIHDSDDPVESIGIERSKKAFNDADLLLLLFDASEKLSEEDFGLMEYAKGRSCIAVLNKQDLSAVTKDSDVRLVLPDCKVVETSFADGSGVEELKDAIESIIANGSVRREEDVLVTNVRHAGLIRNALEELSEAADMVRRGQAIDFIEVNVKAAFDYLGEITGDTASDEVIEEVFSRFCLGK